MIRTLRAFFLSRLFREKMLLVGLLGIAVVMWGSAFWTRANRFWHAQKTTTQELKTQDDWLRRKGDIEAATHEAAAQLDPAKTLDPTGLLVEVRRIANDAGLGGKLSNSPVAQGPNVGQFAINSVRLTLNAVDWHAFAVFYQKLQERAPYIAITEIALNPMRGNPAQVQASLVVASFEIKH